eukprot:m.715272 g.715272  ORF g.715272 m.715272 type:complete len:332 (-) comp22978_c0_seq12:2905-3900(-)
MKRPDVQPIFWAMLSSLCATALAKIVFTGVLPHGDFALDPSLVHNKNGSLEVHNAAVALGVQIAQVKPDLVLLTTPHGIELSNSYAFYTNTNGSGFALIGQDLHNASFPSYKVPLSVSMSPNISGDLVAVGGGASNNVSALLSFADSEPVALRWGEVVPLHFMRRTLAHVQQSEMGSKNGGDATRVAILSIPTRRYKHDLEMIPGLLDLGGKIGAYLQASPLRVAVVVSADLAHTHQASGPYGFSPAAKPFDTACARWGATLDANALLQTAAHYVDDALSCGFTGLVFLHGLITNTTAASHGRIQFAPTLSAYAAPTYYGMMVASMIPDTA